MKIYGAGTFTASNCSRVIWDFADGPFDTVNPVLIQQAKRQGYSFTPLEPAITPEPVKVVTELPKDTPARRGRKPKGKSNVNPKTN